MTLNEQTIFAAFLDEAMNYVNAWCKTEINEGGCGFFAQILSEKLKKKGIEHQVIALWYEDTETGKMEELEKVSEEHFKELVTTNKNPGKAGADHIVTKVGNLYVDSTGIGSMKFLAAKDTVILTDEQVATVNQLCKWNHVFDKDCIPHIKQLMDKVWEKYNTFTSGCFKLPGYHEVEFTRHTKKYLHAEELDDRVK